MAVSDRVLQVLAWGFRFALFATTAWVLAQGDWILGGTGVAMLVVAFAPFVVGKWSAYEVPRVLDVLVAAAASAHLFGHTLGWYNGIPGYDKILHFLVSLVPAFVIYLGLMAWVERVGMQRRTGEDVSLPFIGIITVALTALVGVVWEVLELVTDVVFSLENQKSNLDTMLDLVLDTSAGILIALTGRHLRHADGAIADTREAMEDNVDHVVSHDTDSRAQ